MIMIIVVVRLKGSTLSHKRKNETVLNVTTRDIWYLKDSTTVQFFFSDTGGFWTFYLYSGRSRYKKWRLLNLNIIRLYMTLKVKPLYCFYYDKSILYMSWIKRRLLWIIIKLVIKRTSYVNVFDNETWNRCVVCYNFSG